MALEMRSKCETCSGQLEHGDAAFICSHECTYCQTCAAKSDLTCPNCGGELVKRPRRQAADACPIEGGASSAT